MQDYVQNALVISHAVSKMANCFVVVGEQQVEDDGEVITQNGRGAEKHSHVYSTHC